MDGFEKEVGKIAKELNSLRERSDALYAQHADEIQFRVPLYEKYNEMRTSLGEATRSAKQVSQHMLVAASTRTYTAEVEKINDMLASGEYDATVVFRYATNLKAKYEIERELGVVFKDSDIDKEIRAKLERTLINAEVAIGAAHLSVNPPAKKPTEFTTPAENRTLAQDIVAKSKKSVTDRTQD